VLKGANPGPLGLAGFGLTTVVLSCVNAGILPPAGVAAVVPLAFAFGGVAQLIAGVLEFKTGNTFGMVAFTSYGLFWWWFAFLKWTVGAGWLQAPPASAVAVTLLMWGVFTLLLWIVSFRLSKGVWSIFLLLWITFFFSCGRRLRLSHRELELRKDWRVLWAADWNRCSARCFHRGAECDCGPRGRLTRRAVYS
jgi:succinate-acetate transporter protein